MSELKTKAINAVKWSFITIIAGRIVDIVLSIIKYRILDPEDYGIMAIVIAIISNLRMIQTLGFGNVLVQKHSLNDTLINSVFWIIVVTSTLLSLCLILLSSWISSIYNEKILLILLPIASAEFIFNSYILVQNALLTRELKFKIVGLIGLLSSICGGLITIGFASYGYGVWSLMFGSLVASLITFLLYKRYIRWNPSFMFNWNAVKSSLNFGLSITGRKILAQIIITSLPLLIGRFMGVDVLGIYSFAQRITQMIVGQVDAVLSQVLFPLFSRLQNEKTRLIRGFLKANHFTFLLVIPFIAGYFFIAEDFIGVVYGQKWLAAVVISQIVLISTVFESIQAKISSLLTGIGRPDLLLKIELFLFIPFIVALFITAKIGILQLVTAMALGRIVAFAILQLVLRRFYSIPVEHKRWVPSNVSFV